MYGVRVYSRPDQAFSIPDVREVRSLVGSDILQVAIYIGHLRLPLQVLEDRVFHAGGPGPPLGGLHGGSRCGDMVLSRWLGTAVVVRDRSITDLARCD